jgi:octaprenyl-diphosphate synthase
MIEATRGQTAPGERDLYALVEEFFRTTFATDNALITEAVRRMLAAGGKRLRPRLTLLAVEANGADPRDQLPLAAYMELIHVGTLIHDDVVDRVSVLAGDYLFAWIFKNVTAGYPAPIPHILSSTLADITDGEVLQLRALGNLELPLSGYIETALKKTASLFAASTECGAIVAGASPRRVKALRDFGRYYGVAFQMLDDLLDVTGNAAELGKPVGNDLREHKMTIPLILALEGGDGDFRADVERYYKGEIDPGRELEQSAKLAEGIERSGGLTRTREALAGYVDRAKMSLAPLGNEPARAELAALADGLTRDSLAAIR